MKSIEVVHQNYHMQGFSSGEGCVYWSFTDSLVKTSASGTMKCQVGVDGGHLGDIDYHDGKIYASYLGFAREGHAWDDWTSFKIYVYAADDLRLLDRINLDICDRYKAIAGSGGDTRGFNAVDGVSFGKDPATGDARMFVACAIRDGEKYANQIILQLTPDGRFEKEYHVPTGNTVFGIQNLDYDTSTGEFWFSTYGAEKPYQPRETLYRLAPDIVTVREKYEFSTPYGFECQGGGRYLASLQSGVNGNRAGVAYECGADMFTTKKSEAEINEYIHKLQAES